MSMEFVAGCLGGCAGVAVGHPLDTIKVRLQTQNPRNPKYSGTWDCFRKTLHAESIRGLYRGMSSPMAGVAFVNAIVFGVHGNIMKNVENPNSLRSHFLAGATAGFVQSFICSPMELAKTRIQLQSELAPKGPQYKNPLQCLRAIFRGEGFRGVFRGQGITVIREIPALGTYFVSYEYLSRLLSGDGDPNAAVVLTAGGMAGIASWVLTYPIDVIKSRIQADGMSGVNQYKGSFHCLRTGLQVEGSSFLIRGMNSTIIRAFPTNAATFAVVSWSMKLMNMKEEVEIENQDLKEIFKTGEGLINASYAPPIKGIQASMAGSNDYLRNIHLRLTSNFLPKVTAADLTVESDDEIFLTNDNLELDRSSAYEENMDKFCTLGFW